jgi:hypothetical protein
MACGEGKANIARMTNNRKFNYLDPVFSVGCPNLDKPEPNRKQFNMLPFLVKI